MYVEAGRKNTDGQNDKHREAVTATGKNTTQRTGGKFKPVQTYGMHAGSGVYMRMNSVIICRICEIKQIVKNISRDQLGYCSRADGSIISV